MAMTPLALTAHRLAWRQRLLIKAKVRKEARIKRANEAMRKAFEQFRNDYSLVPNDMPIPRHGRF